ncbi:hypothetical protein [Streptomyces sp. NPDC007206]|uniref:hypothetical protein n=1 Tax=Streptomyces sp. NPDC007206 TaxID=3154317 RepID=UPI0033F8219F
MDWAPLDHCRMTDSGLAMPALEELCAKGTVRDGGTRCEPLPGSLPLSGGQIVFAVDTELAPPSSRGRAASMEAARRGSASMVRRDITG